MSTKYKKRRCTLAVSVLFVPEYALLKSLSKFSECQNRMPQRRNKFLILFSCEAYNGLRISQNPNRVLWACGLIQSSDGGPQASTRAWGVSSQKTHKYVIILKLKIF